MNYRDLLGQRNIDFQNSIARIKNKLNEKQKHRINKKLIISKHNREKIFLMRSD